ncbi:NAD(P)H-binding protein [Mycobacterium sp. CVI_P3]|uniref:NAD(P)H-binding protein n=1 Tax=Mycobacterium pinniadriaticum TaxID=2994102 RepID=A0ABT3SBF5_9MYCO|nr:NAD(P)H-binding protein [Mycobacterium pinniadriaticum]MCX2929903.1 NAD(P)H-binding protein [Mycobacterium pinniadriaticum]MCX2936448.1 NAD(P)H-binding protein [Mycobacterium pinniadriaticum]
MAKLVLFGASGYAGSRILDEAIRRGHEVTAVARRRELLPAARDSVRTVAGSLHDSSLVDELTADADVLICAVTSGPDHAGHTLLDALPSMVAAAQSRRVRIAVVGGASSLLLADSGEPVLTTLESIAPPDKLRDIRLHNDFLDALRRTPDDVDWFYLSPPTGFGAHVPGERLGHYRVGADVLLADDQGNSAISGEDYAIAFLDEIERPRHHRCRFTVAY